METTASDNGGEATKKLGDAVRLLSTRTGVAADSTMLREQQDGSGATSSRLPEVVKKCYDLTQQQQAGAKPEKGLADRTREKTTGHNSISKEQQQATKEIYGSFPFPKQNSGKAKFNDLLADDGDDLDGDEECAAEEAHVRKGSAPILTRTVLARSISDGAGAGPLKASSQDVFSDDAHEDEDDGKSSLSIENSQRSLAHSGNERSAGGLPPSHSRRQTGETTESDRSLDGKANASSSGDLNGTGQRRRREHRSPVAMLSRGASKRRLSPPRKKADSLLDEIPDVTPSPLSRVSTGNPISRRAPLDLNSPLPRSMRAGLTRSVSEKGLGQRNTERKVQDTSLLDSDPDLLGDSTSKPSTSRRRANLTEEIDRGRRPRKPTSRKHRSRDEDQTGEDKPSRDRSVSAGGQSDCGSERSCARSASPPGRVERRRKPRGEDRERRHRKRSPRRGEPRSLGASPTRPRNARAKHYYDITRSQFENVVKNYDPDESMARFDDDEENVEETEDETPEVTTGEEADAEADDGRKAGIFAFASTAASKLKNTTQTVTKTAVSVTKTVASTATQTASNTAKLGAKVASTAASTATQQASKLGAKVASSTAKTAAKPVSDSLGVSSHHGKKTGSLLANSISDLAGGGLGDSSSALMAKDDFHGD